MEHHVVAEELIKNFTLFFLNPKFYYGVHNGPLLDRILGQLNTACITNFYLFMIHFSIILHLCSQLKYLLKLI
jgi:hypothetical protein